MSFKYFKGKNGHSLYKKHESDAGWDVACSEPVTIPNGQSRVAKTDLFFAIPYGYVGILKSRSGVATHQGVDVVGVADVAAGVIDADYRGEVKILLRNTSTAPVKFNHGDRVAQLIVLKCELAAPELVESIAQLTSTDRGDGGFGSTGV